MKNIRIRSGWSCFVAERSILLSLLESSGDKEDRDQDNKLFPILKLLNVLKSATAHVNPSSRTHVSFPKDFSMDLREQDQTGESYDNANYGA